MGGRRPPTKSQIMNLLYVQVTCLFTGAGDAPIYREGIEGTVFVVVQILIIFWNFQHVQFSTFQLFNFSTLFFLHFSTFQLFQLFNFSTFELSLKDTKTLNFQLQLSTLKVPNLNPFFWGHPDLFLVGGNLFIPDP